MSKTIGKKIEVERKRKNAYSVFVVVVVVGFLQ